jgi:hypothetical protein
VQQASKAKGKTSGAGRRKSSDEEIEIEAILDVKEQAGSWKEFKVQYKGNNGTAWLSEKVIKPGLIRDFMLKFNKKEDEKEEEEPPTTPPVVTEQVASSSSTSNDNSLPTVTHVIYRNPTPTPSATIETMEGEKSDHETLTIGDHEGEVEVVELVAVAEAEADTEAEGDGEVEVEHILSGKEAGGVPDVEVAVVSG